MKIMCVCGARPNFMKIAPIISAFKGNGIETILVHTGQHYSPEMSDLFFRQLEIPQPDINLGVGSGSHAFQTAEIMTRFEPVLIETNPDALLVVGDVNSTIACGLVAVKLGVKLIHVEAGLRSFDRTMPEEINRILTDSISDMLFVTEQSGMDNLAKEGVCPSKVFLVGNVMIDTLMNRLEKAEKSEILETLSISAKNYALLTIHRPSNVDCKEDLENIYNIIAQASERCKLVFPIHPRTKNSFERDGFGDKLTGLKNLIITEPLGYLDFLKLINHSAFVLTDSGGIQEETTALKIPCLTMRENTERPSTITLGSNRLVGLDSKLIIESIDKLKETNYTTQGTIPPLWDGNAAKRIANIICQ